MVKCSYETSVEGVPQGGSLSLLLANIMLNELDKELFRRGHKFVRYADDCLILCRSKRAVARVRESIFTYIESRQDRGGLCRQGKVFRLLFLQVYL